jgi:hypothetical protein
MAMGADPTKVMGRRVVATLIDGTLVLGPVIAYSSSELTYVTKDQIAPRTLTTFCDSYIQANDGSVCFRLGDSAYYGSGGAGPSLVLMGLAVVMFVVLQGLTGWTVGKLITGIRTVREDGQNAGLLKCLIRWLMWIVDGLPFAGLVGFIVGLTTTGHRRVGDMVAKTFVVRSTAAGHAVQIPGLTTAPGVTTADLGSIPAPPVAKHGPQWDDARGTYIQWDPEQQAWVQWDEAGRVWNRMPGQGGDEPPPAPPPPPPPPPPSL